MQREFEDQFEYELTEDQQHAVEEIKHDMESPRPMDRLLCGDVGFGKTEVAVRAAFKAVMDNKQVAFLCPTTILSMQHYKTFIDRFRDYPVNIKVVNRFVPRKEQNQIIQDMAEGKVDIIIGTHRLLSKDMKWKDLGFLVIDEEQRFGVEHKERIKELKTGIDVLSLSATPIPRTLQMSLVGIRSLSQLNSPPSNRHPVQTYVIERNFNMIREIIQRELARNGQVFYLYNRIEDIYQVAKELRKAFPDIGIGVAHGQMDREDIEDVMMEFNANKYQVLVCTTIIETGIDIPNANTILIEDADRFGLSQLYQIRGRVGRSSRVAYAYLMYRPQKQLNETAMKRLKSIREFTQLGSGYKIAMRDLTIRGAGDLLGPQQAGFIDSVGIDMYMEMLHDAIARHRGLKQEEKEEAPVRSTNVQVDAYIPDQFAPEDGDKLSLYQQIEKIRTVEELHRLMDEVRDLFGKLPNEVRLLFEKKQLDLLAAQPYVEDFKETPRELRIIFTKEWSDHVDGVKLFERMNQISRLIRLGYAEGKVSLIIPKSRRQLEISIDGVEIEILQQESKGILGIGARPAKVRLTEREPEEVVMPDYLKEPPRPNRDRPRRERSDRPRRERGDRNEREARMEREAQLERENRGERPLRRERERKPERPEKPAIPYSLEAAQDNPGAIFLQGLIQHMGVEGQVLAYVEEETL